MDVTNLIVNLSLGTSVPIWASLLFGLLVGTSVLLLWMAFAPAPPQRAVTDRLEGYLASDTVVADTTLDKPFFSRVVSPLFRRLLHILGRLLPQRNVEATRQMLVHAGEPGRFSPLDFYGLRVLALVVLAGGYFLVIGLQQPFSVALRNTLLLGVVAFWLPRIWLMSRVRQRKRAISRALPDALDMMTIGVEAGLAFESAMLRVGEQWDNALTRELSRAVGEMRIGTPRDVALRRMADRTGVPDLATFVAVLIQSSQLGVTIAQVLHTQAAEMRTKRRQRAEEIARQASVKMVFPLIFFIFPSLLVVMLGPAIPMIIDFFGSVNLAIPTTIAVP